MALITINGVAVLSGTIVMPLTGVWTADLVIDQSDGSGFDAGKAVTISSPDLELKGTVDPNRTGDFLDTVHIRVLGGAAGMAKTATPKSFSPPGVYVRDVINEIASQSGETLSGTVAQSFLGTSINAWSVSTMPLSQALVFFLNTAASANSWRILTDGTLWIGEETWTKASPAYDLLVHNPTDGTYELGIESPSIVPGTEIDGVGKIGRVEHRILSDNIRSHVWVDLPGQDRGFVAAVSSIAAQALPGVDYLALYDATLIGQSSDLTTVDVTPGDPRLAAMSRVPLRHGLPGCKVQVSNGAGLRIGWDRGNPTLPYACLWNGGESVQEITLTASLVNIGGSDGDNVLTKDDETALISAITAMANTGNTGGPLTFTAPSTFSSDTVKATR